MVAEHPPSTSFGGRLSLILCQVLCRNRTFARRPFGEWASSRHGWGLKLPVRPLAMTGFCIASSLGVGQDPTLSARRSGTSGLAPCRFETVDLPTYLGEVPGLDDWRLDRG